jgi:hypothetical protein
MKLITAFLALLVAKDAAVLDDAATDVALLDQTVKDISQLDPTTSDLVALDNGAADAQFAHPKRGAAYNAPGAVNPLASTYACCSCFMNMI